MAASRHGITNGQPLVAGRAERGAAAQPEARIAAERAPSLEERLGRLELVAERLEKAIEAIWVRMDT